MTRGEQVIAFIEEYIRIPEGSGVARPMILMDFQKSFILRVFDNPRRTRRAILSVGRKNSKTTLIGAILLAYIIGPVAETNSQLYSAAHSRDQSGIVFKLMAKMVRAHPELTRHITIRDSINEMLCTMTGVTFRALSSDSTNALGMSPIAFVADEGGSVKGPTWPLFDSLHSGQAAYENPIEFIISTQAASDADWLSIMIDDARASKDPRVICDVFEAPAGCDLLDEEAWRAANPALGTIVSIEELRGLAQEAARLPSREASFRNLNLNQRVADEAKNILTITSWAACGDDPPRYAGEPVYVGLDLSHKADLTACVGVWESADAKLNVAPHFYLPTDGLADKSRRDGFDYVVAERSGLLRSLPGAAMDYDDLGREVLEVFSDWNVAAVAYDRHRIDDLKAALRRLGAPETLLEKFVPWGQGFVGFAPAVDALEAAALNKKLRHGGHGVLTMCIANARVVRDPAGNRKLDKRTDKGRIDGAVALAMALGLAEQRKSVVSAQKKYQLFFVGQ